MAFLLIGLLLLGLKMAAFGPVAELGWFWVLLPFGLAVAWWAFADSSGLTQKRAMRRMDERKEERRQKQVESLGLDPRKRPMRLPETFQPQASPLRDPMQADPVQPTQAPPAPRPAATPAAAPERRDPKL